MKWVAEHWLTPLLLLAAGLMLWLSFDLSRVSAWIPRSVLVVTCALLVAQFALDGWRSRGPAPAADAREPDERSAREWAAAAWILALLFAVWLLGVVAGSALFCLGWMRWHAGERALASLALAAAVGLVLWLVFGGLPGPGLYSGLVGGLIA